MSYLCIEKWYKIVLQKIKTWMLPLAMLTGAFFYDFFQHLSFLTPYLIFSMLFITYCKLSFRDLKFSRLHLWLLLVQVVGCVVVYGILRWFDPVVAEGGLICILAPTATAAAVITGMLGGSIACLAAYTLISSLAVAVFSPVIFSLLGEHAELTFWDSVFYICKQVMPLLVFPCVGALLLEKVLPAVHCQFKKLQILSFYLWALGLTIVTGKTVYFIVHQENADIGQEWWMAVLALGICVCQFGLGRYIGQRYGDTVAGGQGLGQKNTILAIWMAQTYLNPLSSIAPASYVLWQNLINSYQLWKKERNKS